MYRFALRPKWILSHLFVLGLVVLMVSLGFWQLRRLDERRAFNDTVRASLAAPPAARVPGEEPAEWQRIVLRGTFRPGTDVLVANRAQNGQAGYWVLGALDTTDGTVVVDRGFVLRSLVAQGALRESVPPAGEVEFVATVQASRRGVFATSVGAAGVIEISQVDVAALGSRWGVDVAPYWVHATPAQGKLLEAVAEPTLGDGPHISYAVQWFVFSTIAVIGYPLILRRNARARAAGIDREDDDVN